MYCLTHCILGNFSSFFVSADFFQNKLFAKILSGIKSECQTVWTQIRPDDFVGPDLGPNRLQKLSADGTGRQILTASFQTEKHKQTVRPSQGGTCSLVPLK